MKGSALGRVSSDTTEDLMGETAASGGDEERAVEHRQRRRQLIRQLLLDWSPVVAGLANLMVQHFL